MMNSELSISISADFMPLPSTHRNPSGCSPSLLLGSLSMVYLARLRSPKFLPLAKTSDIPKPLYAIVRLKKEKKFNKISLAKLNVKMRGKI